MKNTRRFELWESVADDFEDQGGRKNDMETQRVARKLRRVRLNSLMEV
jgi:hypothetical protein